MMLDSAANPNDDDSPSKLSLAGIPLIAFVIILNMTVRKSSIMNFRCEDVLVDVSVILKERSQRYRIGNAIFEDPADVHDSNGEICPAENADVGGVLKLVQNTQSINFKRIGVDVFNLTDTGKFFDEAKLHSNLCKSTPDNMINHPLFNISKENMREIIQRGLLKQQMKKHVLYSLINKYLFFLMSCHTSELLVSASCDTLIYHILTSSKETNTCNPLWRPSVDDIMLVFCNYGAPRELLSWDSPLPQRVLSNELTEDQLNDHQIKNIPWVLKVISSVLVHHKNAFYTLKELDNLLGMIITVSLDKHIVKIQSVNLNVEFSKCIKSILAAYPSSKWQKQGKISSVSQALYNKLRNVHISDVYFIINNYISCPGFGQKLALSLTHAFIKATVERKKTITHLDNVDVKHIGRIFKVDSLLELDYYTQYYVLLMVEKAITNLIFTSGAVRHLNRIGQLLSNLRIKPPHSEDMVDYLLVKELVTRAATTWKLSVAEVT